MPMQRLERCLGLSLLCGSAALVAVLPAWAQSATSSPVSAPGPVPVDFIQPTLNVQALTTSNSELARGGSASGKSETVITVTPGIAVQLKGAQSELAGQFQLDAVRYVRGTQSDRVLPSGDMRLKLEAVKDAVGLDASVRAARVRADTTALQATPTGTDNAYVDTTVHLAPYARGRLDANTLAEVRFDRGLLDSTQAGSVNNGLSANQRDAATSDDRVRLFRKPTPLGYEVQFHRQSERFRHSDAEALAQRDASVSVLLAPDPELTIGLKLLRAQDRIQGREFDNTSVGYQAEWRPTPRSFFQAQTEERSHGRAWMVDLQHRWRQLSLGIRADREATSFAREASRNAVTLPSLRPPSGPPTGAAGTPQEPPQPFDTGAQIRQGVQGRMTLMGRRNEINFSAGFIKTAALSVSGTGELTTTGGRRTREHYFETQLTHQLTPINSLSGGLRWGRMRATRPLTGEDVLSRDFIVRAALDTRLSPDTTATVGLKRQITHGSQATGANETAGYVGLGHRF